ncbi:MAG: hypothetical protein ABJO09_07405 [Hyphomicrobiales bacterium]
MLSKILILIVICAAVYIVTQRHKLFASKPNTKSGNGSPGRGADTIEELDYDPKTGHYRVKDRKNDKK